MIDPTPVMIQAFEDAAGDCSAQDVPAGLRAAFAEVEKTHHVVPRNPERVTVFVGLCRHQCSTMQIQPGGGWMHIPSLSPCAAPPLNVSAVR